MKKALIVIDYTNDFVHDEGALTCGKPGQELEGYIVNQIHTFLSSKNLVVFATDVHYEGDIGHPETALFPPHNIAGTEGRHLYGDVQRLYKEHKGSQYIKWMDG